MKLILAIALFLDQGSYEVGYKTFTWIDSTRQYADAPRAVQVFVWYPAASAGERMKFGEYFTDMSNDWGTGKDDVAYLANYFQTGFTTAAMNPSFPGKLSDEEFKKLLNSRTVVTKNVKPATGKFPVILHRHVTAALHQSVAMEFLASHGYVVASVSAYNSSIAYYGRGQDDAAGLMSATEDLAFIASKLRNLSFADTERMGMYGMMAHAGISLQMKQPVFKALACLDCLGYKETLELMPHFNLVNFRIPVLELINSDFDDQVDSSRSYFDTLEYSNRWIGRFKNVSHPDFYPYRKLVQRETVSPSNHDRLLQLTLNFFNATLAGNRQPDHSLLTTGLTAGFVSIHHKTALPAPPSKEELLARVRYGPIEDARTWLNEFSQLRAYQSDLFFFTVLMVRADDPLSLEASKLYFQHFREPAHFDLIAESFKMNGRVNEANVVLALKKQ